MVSSYSNWLIKWRYPIVIACFIGTFLIANGTQRLTFDTDYRVFFSDENPELLAFERLQNTYNKEDNILIALTPKNNNIFTKDNLGAIEWLTKEAWQIPFSSRVDSISNYQHTRAEEDDLIVEDLVYGAQTLDDKQIQYIKQVSLSEPRLVNSLINQKGSIAGINVVNQFPGESQTENPEATAFTRNLIKRFEEKYPQFEVHLSGLTMLNNAFNEASINDMKSLIPLMYLFIFITLFLLLKSVSALLGIIILITFSIVSAMGVAGFMGIALTPPSVSAPTIIMTLAVADSVHFLVSMLVLMRKGLDKNKAIIESLRINIGPIFLTSITTAIGFLAMNTSDAPPFHDLGNITAVGVMFALLFSITFLPAWMAILPVKVKQNTQAHKKDMMDQLADFVIKKHKLLLWACGLFLLAMIALIPRIVIDDNFVEYFDESVEFRTDSDYIIDNLTGINMDFFSIESGQEQGINNPQFLAKVNEFTNWLEQQPEVLHVNAITDVMKRLNKNLHADDEAFYKVPNNQELAAQYLLLYEMSLPYGLDLNNQINVDKSATKVAVTLGNLSTSELLNFNARAEQWLVDNAPKIMQAKGTSTGMMFSNITIRNINSTLTGSTIALLLISLILLFTLKSVKMGLISLIPNLSPAIAALGVWAITYQVLGMAAAIVFAISIGVVVDDTVHFLSKYLRARREKKLDAPDAIRYAFATVGQALWVTTLVLVVGFALLSQSSFLVNQQTGILMAITITLALILDFLLLPAILLAIDKNPIKEQSSNNNQAKTINQKN